MSIVTKSIKKLYEEEGIDIYKDAYRYYALAEDYISDRDPRFLEQLYHCIRNDILKTIYEIHQTTSDRKRQKFFRKAEQLFVKSNKYSPQEAAAFLQNYCDAFEWKNITFSSGHVKEASPQQPKPAKHKFSKVVQWGTAAALILLIYQNWDGIRTFVKESVSAVSSSDTDGGSGNDSSVNVRDEDIVDIDLIRENENPGANSAETDPEALPPTEALVLSGVPSFDTMTYQQVSVTDAFASSTIHQENVNNEPVVMFDGLSGTSWQEGVSGYGIGETAECSFDQFYQVKYIAFRLGNWRSQDYFVQNGIPSVLKISLGDFSQDVYFHPMNGMPQVQWVEFTNPISANTLQLEIRDIWTGSKYEDTCISEITVYGIRE